MNVHLPAARRRWPGRLLNVAVVIVVLALAAATFVLSYSGVHAIVAQAGVSARLARLYPAVFDAVLVIACLAAVTLRDARWWARAYAWLVIVIVMAVVGAADAVHAMNVTLPHRKLEGVVAAAPWVLVLLGFSLMLTMLRHSRAAHSAASATPAGRAARRAAKREAPDITQAGLPATGTVRAIAAPPRLAQSAASATAPASEPTAPASPFRAPMADFWAAAAEHEDLPDEATPEQAATGTETSLDLDAPSATVPLPEVSATADAAQAADVAAAEPGDAVTDDTAAEADETGLFGTSAAQNDYWDADEEIGRRVPGYQPVAEAAENAPPFATAPFATVPRLNRVRATPTPPEEGDE